MGSCVAVIDEVCGQGTVALDGSCVPAAGVECSASTVQVNGICVVADPSSRCGPLTVLRDGDCVGLDTIAVALPYPAGEVATVLQADHGPTHRGRTAYAVDFDMTVGSVVTASHGGRVLQVIDNSSVGFGNVILIDHGDTTVGRYARLQAAPMLVSVGQSVCAGQPIAHSGDAHLHFEVFDIWGQSVPLRFSGSTSDEGTVFVGGPFTSDNIVPADCAVDFDFSDCQPETFSGRGVRLESGTPCTAAVLDQPYLVSGTVITTNFVLIHQSVFGESWSSTRCVAVNAAGRFALEIVWPTIGVGRQGQMMFSAAWPSGGGRCTPTDDWDRSPVIYLME